MSETMMLSDETTRKVLTYFKDMMEFAKEKKYPGYEDFPLYDLRAIQGNKPTPEKPKDHVYVTLEEAIYLATLKTPDTLAFRRRKFSAAWLFLSGQRARAFATTSLKCVDLEKCEVQQYPSLGVETKNRKSQTTFLYNIPELLNVVEEWFTTLKNELSPDALIFTPLHQEFNTTTLSEQYQGAHRNKKVTKDLEILYEYAKESQNTLFERKTAHKFRHGHAYYGLSKCKTPQDYRAISQNLMHNNSKITDIYTAHNTEKLGKHIDRLSSGTLNQPTDVSQDSLHELSILLENMIGKKFDEKFSPLKDQIAEIAEKIAT